MLRVRSLRLGRQLISAGVLVIRWGNGEGDALSICTLLLYDCNKKPTAHGSPEGKKTSIKWLKDYPKQFLEYVSVKGRTQCSQDV
jgi:hypothetical protein